MTNSIPKRGPAVVKLSNGDTLDLWYDGNPGVRCWVLAQKDSEGNQIGPGYEGSAEYSHSREEAVNSMEQIIRKVDAIQAHNAVLDAEALKGDAPGAAPVTIEVDGRKLVLPRALMTSIVTFAYNRGCEKADAEQDDLGRAWLVNFVEDVHKLGEFIKSR
jgi:hypothetical protein